MALTFGGASSDRVEITAASSINDLNPFTIVMWVYPTSLVNNKKLCQKGLFATGGFFGWNLNGTGGNLETSVRRAGASTSYITNSTPLAITNKWYCVALTYNSAASAGQVHNMYIGDLTTIVSEATYGTATDGSGSTSAQAAGEKLYVGNFGSANQAFPGHIAFFGMWNRELSLGEVQDQQFQPHKTSGNVVFIHLGFNGTSTQPDWSGNGNAGTVTGASQSAHVPLGPPFGLSRHFPYTVAAAVPSLDSWYQLTGGPVRENHIVTSY